VPSAAPNILSRAAAYLSAFSFLSSAAFACLSLKVAARLLSASASESESSSTGVDSWFVDRVAIPLGVTDGFLDSGLGLLFGGGFLARTFTAAGRNGTLVVN
jgi:hypothetical protein